MATISIGDDDARYRVTLAVTKYTTQIPITFPFFDLDDIKVIRTLNGVDQAFTRGTVTSNHADNAYVFEVLATAVDDGYSGGNIRVSETNTDPQPTYTIYRDIPVARTIDFPATGVFNVNALNTEVDKLWAAMQQLETELSRSVRMIKTDADNLTITLPSSADRSGEYLYFDANGNLTTRLDGASAVMNPTYTSLYLEGATSNEYELQIVATDPTADRVWTIPDSTDTFVGLTTHGTLTNKVIVAPAIMGDITGSVLQNDASFASTSPNKIASSQSIKAYVDAQVDTKDALSELDDVAVTGGNSPNNNELLGYDSSSGKWTSKTGQEAGLMTSAGGTFTSDVLFDSYYEILFDKSESAIDFTDGAAANFGDNSDLVIKHYFNSSYISNKTGHLYIQNSLNSSGDIKIQNKAGNDGITIKRDGTIDSIVELYHDDDLKFETTSSGVKTTGTLDVNGAYSLPTSIGSSGQVLQVPSSGTQLEFVESSSNNVTGDLTITSTENDGPVINLVSNDPSDAANWANEGTISFKARNDANEQLEYAKFMLTTADIADGAETGRLKLNLTNGGGGPTASYQFASNKLFLENDNHAIRWNNTKGTNYDLELVTTTPTANRTYTLPDATGTVITTGNMNNITDIGIQQYTIQLGAGANLEFEGATGNNHETILTVTDPTQDNTITLPDATGTVALTSDLSSFGTLSNIVEDTTPQLGGALDVNGAKILSTSNGNIDIEPHGTGDVLLGNFVFDADQTVGGSQDNYVMTYDNSTGKISLEAPSGGGGGGSSAADDITTGDAAVNIETSSGNITIDAQGNDTDIIFKGTDNNADITMLTLDGSEAGDATLNANLGVGATPNTNYPDTSWNAIDVSAKGGLVAYDGTDGVTGETIITTNAYHNGTNWKAKATGESSGYSAKQDGTHTFYSTKGTSANADADVTLSTQMSINAGGDLGINTNPSPSNSYWKTNVFIGQKGSIVADNSSPGATYLAHNIYIDDTTWKTRTTGTSSTTVLTQDGTFYIYKGSSVSTGQTPTFTEEFKLNNTLDGGMQFHGNDVALATPYISASTLVHSISDLSSYSTAGFSSTYVNDDYDYYDVYIYDAKATANTVTAFNYLYCRIKHGNTTITTNGSYVSRGYLSGMKINPSYDSWEPGSWASNSNLFFLNPSSSTGDAGMGAGSQSTWNGHYRFYNFRNTTTYKGFRQLDGQYFSHDLNYGTPVYYQPFGFYDDGTSAAYTTKIDGMEFGIGYGSPFTGGSMRLYGWKK